MSDITEFFNEPYEEEERKAPDAEELAKINKAIDEFFDGMKLEWINPARVRKFPDKVDKIYESLSKFFARKRWHAGGKIPDELLYTRENFHVLNNVSIVSAIDLLYSSIAVGQELARTQYRENIEIVLTISVMHECGRLGVLQEHIGGVILLYFMLCEKVVLL